MILIDLSQCLHAAIAIDSQQEDKPEFDEDFVRYIVLNIIRANKVKFKKEFGSIVICCDAGNVWRKDIFPFYKQKREDGKKESIIDWNVIYKSFNKIRDELKENFPFPVIHVNKCEGDDVIAVLCQELKNEKILILSTDKDFAQLQTSPNVFQYSPTLKKDIICADPERQLRKLILKGDGGDGIPSVFSTDNYLVMREKGDRSKPISEKMIDESMIDLEAFLNKYDVKRNFERNETLINLDKIPVECKNAIFQEFIEQLKKPNKSILKYLIQHKQRQLADRINDFA